MSKCLIEWDTIVMKVFLSILKQKEFHSVQKIPFKLNRIGSGDCFPIDFEPNRIPFGSKNRKENCHQDHIPFNVKENENISFLSVV